MTETEKQRDRELRTAQEENRGVGRSPLEQDEADEAQAMAVEEIPNPGPDDEPMPQLQAFHAEQTDPPEGPYPDPPTGPYPDPAIKDAPTEDQVFNVRSSSKSTPRGRAAESTPARTAARG
jgi:hypothetical protein